MSTSRQQKLRLADKAIRAEFVMSYLSATSNLQPHSPNEEATMAKIEQALSISKDNFEKVDCANSQTFPKHFMVNSKDGISIGTCTGTVHASPEELLAFLYLTNTHEARDSHIAANGPDSSKYPNKTIHVVNDHHKITYSCRKLPPPLKPREWLARGIFKQVDEDNFILFYTPVADDDPDLPPSFSKTTLKSAIRGEFTAMHKYERLPHNQTRFAFTTRVDIKGSVPKAIANMGMTGVLDTVRQAYKYFQRDEEIDELEVSLTDNTK